MPSILEENQVNTPSQKNFQEHKLSFKTPKLAGTKPQKTESGHVHPSKKAGKFMGRPYELLQASFKGVP